MSLFTESLFYVVHLFALTSALLYALASAYYVSGVLRTRREFVDGADSKLFWANTFHSVFLIEQCFHAVLPAAHNVHLVLPSSALSLSWIAWLLSAIYLYARRWLPLQGLGAFIAPLATVLTCAAAFLFHRGSQGPALELSPLLVLHIALCVLGHAAFVAAFGVSVALILQERLLKRRSFALVMRIFPPLRTLDSLNRSLLSAGLLTMGFGVLLGLLVALDAGQPALFLSSRVLWSTLTVALYAGLVATMRWRGFRGSRAAWVSVLGYATIVCSFLSARVLGAVFHVY